MTSYQFKLPDIGEGIAEAEIVAWHVAVGDVIEEDAPLADLMTDKATVEITSPVSGKLLSLAAAVGESVAIGSVLVVLETDGVEASSPEAAASDTPNAAAEEPSPTPVFVSAPAAAPSQATEPSGVHASSGTPAPAPATAPAEGDAAPRRASATPAVRQRAKSLGIDLAQVPVAVGDRVRHADLDTFLHYNQTYRPGTPTRADEEVRVIGLRRRIAENMAASKRNIPHFSYVEEINVSKLDLLREDLNRTRGSRPKLTILPFIILAVCKVLPKFPMMNARFDDQAGVVTRSGAVHLGIATQTDAGLMVPVIRDAHDKNIWQLATDVARLAEAARTGKATSAELSGSTLTITSLGPLGGISTTPVINRPEVAIIGPNRIIERPIVENGEVVIAKLMNVSISCDHRVVDGWDAANFVQHMKNLLETPALLFVD